MRPRDGAHDALTIDLITSRQLAGDIGILIAAQSDHERSMGGLHVNVQIEEAKRRGAMRVGALVKGLFHGENPQRKQTQAAWRLVIERCHLVEASLLGGQQDSIHHGRRQFFVILRVDADGVIFCTNRRSCKGRVAAGVGDGSVKPRWEKRQAIVTPSHDGAGCARAGERRTGVMSACPKLALPFLYPALVSIRNFSHGQWRQLRDGRSIYFTVGRVDGDLEQMG